ncbi:ubiquitin-specific protease ESD4 [Trifolium repens]|nr:ubiquitin-specific protease ESD4 [Trifolium repens]
MGFLSESTVKYDVKANNNVVENLFKVGTNVMEKLVKPFTKESVRPMTKERVRKLYSPYDKDGKKHVVAVTSTPTGCYIKSSKKLVGPFVPSWLSSLFKPKKTMNLNSDQCDMASYIFGHSTYDKKVVSYSRVPFCDETRMLLHGLKHTQMLSGDIVFLLVHDAECLHWFLLVIDFKKKEVIYVDSLPSRSARPRRMRSIKKLNVYMEELITDPAFHVTGTTHTPNVSEFTLTNPNDLRMQADMSYVILI